jgi:putative transcriptional regulator
MPKKTTHIAEAALENVKPISGSEIRTIRVRAKLGQSSFAAYFNRSRSYISQLERGIRQPRGSALVLLNLIRRKGLEAILWLPGRPSPTRAAQFPSRHALD